MVNIAFESEFSVNEEILKTPIVVKERFPLVYIYFFLVNTWTLAFAQFCGEFYLEVNCNGL